MSRKHNDIAIKRIAKELGISTKQAVKGYKKIEKLGLLPNQMRERREKEGSAIFYSPVKGGDE